MLNPNSVTVYECPIAKYNAISQYPMFQGVVVHEVDEGQPCQLCDRCTNGFHPHPWRAAYIKWTEHSNPSPSVKSIDTTRDPGHVICSHDIAISCPSADQRPLTSSSSQLVTLPND
ncbi:hypothetical protein J6590_003329 [Homalodisca vitripennis]|nr:hypothetical protein J6590_003329 [Homalodisca vitripennis]